MDRNHTAAFWMWDAEALLSPHSSHTHPQNEVLQSYRKKSFSQFQCQIQWLCKPSYVLWKLVKQLSSQTWWTLKTGWGKTGCLGFSFFYIFCSWISTWGLDLIWSPPPFFWILLWNVHLQQLLSSGSLLQIVIIYCSFQFCLPALIRINISKNVSVKIIKKNTHLFRWLAFCICLNTCKMILVFNPI